MQVGERHGIALGERAFIALVAALVLCLAGLSPAVAAKGKKKKKGGIAVTRSVPGPLAAGGTQAGTASCPKKTHATGGGLSIAPLYSANGTEAVSNDTGLRTLPLALNPSAANAWSSSAAAFTAPAGAGSLTTFVRCEKNSFGKLAVTTSSSATLQPSAGQNMIFNCPPRTRVIAGGFAADGPASLATPTSFRIIVLGSRRTAPGQWTVSGYNSSAAPGPATMTGYAVCEVTDKRKVSESSAFSALPNDSRAAGEATCSNKQHVISGGFLVSPAEFPGAVPVIGLDEFNPVGSRTWHVAIHSEPPLDVPPGSSLTTIAYCKPNK